MNPLTLSFQTTKEPPRKLLVSLALTVGLPVAALGQIIVPLAIPSEIQNTTFWVSNRNSMVTLKDGVGSIYQRSVQEKTDGSLIGDFKLLISDTNPIFNGQKLVFPESPLFFRSRLLSTTKTLYFTTVCPEIGTKDYIFKPDCTCWKLTDARLEKVVGLGDQIDFRVEGHSKSGKVKSLSLVYPSQDGKREFITAVRLTPKSKLASDCWDGSCAGFWLAAI